MFSPKKNLSMLSIEDPILVSTSAAIVDYLKQYPGYWGMLSIDVQDFFYSLAQNRLLECLNRCIKEDNGEELFIGKCGVSIGNFLELLSFYLKATYVLLEGKLYIQEKGVLHWLKSGASAKQYFLALYR